MKNWLIGIDAGGTNIKMMVCDTDYNILGKESIPTRCKQLDYNAISDNIITALDNIFARAGVTEKHVISVAMGLPGIVDSKNKVSIYQSYLGWDGFNPCEKIAAYYDAPSFIDNDANLNALGEYYFGSKQQYSHMVLLTLGTGVGCGIICDGKIFSGANNLAGELGHMTLTPDTGDTCLCGKKGCMEAYCSGSAMTCAAQRMMEQHPETVLHLLVKQHHGAFDNSYVDEGARQNDAACIEIYRQFNYYLTIGIANIIKMFNPQRVFIGGGLSNAGDLLFGPVNRDVKAYLLHERQYCMVEKAILGPHAGMYGAAAFAGICMGHSPTDRLFP